MQRPDDASVDNLIGIADTKLGQMDEGNRYYKLAIGLDPKLAGHTKIWRSIIFRLHVTTWQKKF